MKNDVLSIQEGIVNHVEYTMARSRYKFDDFEAYQATSLSLRDRLIGEPVWRLENINHLGGPCCMDALASDN